MTDVRLITSFNEDILKTTASHLIQSIKDNVEPSVKLSAYHHDCKLDAYSLAESDSFNFKNLHDIKEYEDFLKDKADHNGTEAGAIPYNAKLDALRWSHKVFALTEEAFSLAEKNIKAGWLIWIDADTYFKKRLTKEDILFILPEGADIVYNSDDPYFMAFNLNKQPPLDLLGDLRGAYISGELIQYREWHDMFLIERLMNIYSAHGMKIHKTSQINNYMYHFKGLYDPTKNPIRDSKGNRLFPLSEETTPDIKPNRYSQIVDLIRHYKPKSIIETGTWNGGRAIEMALTAFEYTDTLNYIGYDLFEDATVETDHEEFNGKAHNKMSAVQKRLEEFAEHVKENKNKTFTFKLIKGNTRETLTDQQSKFDMALIGGGNSIQTVQHDFDCVKQTDMIVMDHYFREDDDNLIPNEAYQGVNEVFKKINKKSGIRKFVLPSGDKVKGGGFTHLVTLLTNQKLSKIPNRLQRVPIVVNPRDCVPKDYIRNNIKENMKLIDKNRWLGKYSLHLDIGIIVSGGPNVDYNEIKKILKENPDAVLLCVKHSYPGLIANGIKPWACVVLDPRDIDGVSTHGIQRKELFKTIEPSTKFLLASMTDPSVTKYLQKNNADIWGWHAFTESLRDDEDRKHGMKNNQVKIRDELGMAQGTTLITGGTCAAMRSIGILHTMGFRQIHLFGFDSSLKDEPTKEMLKETTGAEDEEPRPKYFQVSVKETPYWTTGELLAMAQDCERTFADKSMGINFIFHGKNTLVSDLWELAQTNETEESYKDFFS
jgi:predicted O-methyltransferase YrrM